MHASSDRGMSRKVMLNRKLAISQGRTGRHYFTELNAVDYNEKILKYVWRQIVWDWIKHEGVNVVELSSY